MRRGRGALVVVVLAAAVVVGGCGGSRRIDTTTSGTTTQQTEPVQLTASDLRAAAREAVQRNYALSLYTLWHNKLPPWAPQSTRGPALAGLRSSIQGRQKRGVRIRVLDRKLKIVSLKLDPSYTHATATIQSRQHVRPFRGKRPLGAAVKLDERARLQLRRVDTSRRFVVWKVQLLK